METTRNPHGVPAAPPARGDGGGITRHSKEQLIPARDRDATPGFRLLYNPTPQLGDCNDSEIAFVVEKPRSCYRFDIWTRHGHREGVGLETFQSVYVPNSQQIRVPRHVQMTVRDAWQRGHDISETLSDLHPIADAFQSPATVGEAVTHG